jgi:oxygen-independent coproporphyrinogen-3 oxidase
MYEWATGALAEEGYLQYEISNWALWTGEEVKACRHNLQYWRSLPYLGFGAGAHGFARGVRTANVLPPAAYIQRMLEGTVQLFPRTPATATLTEIDRQTEIGETMMMGLRLVQEGVSDQDFRQRFGQGLNDVFGGPIQRLRGLGLLEWVGGSGGSLRLTPKGRLLGNQVFIEFI